MLGVLMKDRKSGEAGNKKVSCHIQNIWQCMCAAFSSNEERSKL